MITVDYDVKHNMVVIAFKANIDAEQMRQAIVDLERVLSRVKPGFKGLADMASVRTMEPDVEAELKKAMDLINKKGVTEIFRVLPDPDMEIGFDIMSRAHYSKEVKLHTFRSRDEAQALIAQDEQSERSADHAAIHAFAAKSEKSSLEAFEYDPGPLGPEQVELRVTHCGVCHTDAAIVDNEWGISRYSAVPGHEVVGTVSAIGSNVTDLRVGQRVGVGALCGSCMNCEWCRSGRENVCSKVVGTAMPGHHGGFASHVRASNWQFAHPIPDAIASEHAGPLLCGGTTVFTPLLRYNVRPTDRVAVVGIGGLGHLAVQYLSKWGCEVTAISSSPDKDRQAREFGAKHFLATGGTDDLKKSARSFDFILSTVSADLPWDDYLAALRPGGKLCIAGIPDRPIAFQAFGLIGGGKSIVGGQPGSILETRKMLAFTALHGIKPMIETFSMADADRALKHTRQGKARYRAVLVADQ